MKNVNFITTMKRHIECTFCKEHLCAFRYNPTRAIYKCGIKYGGCKKDLEKRFKKILK